MRESYPSEDEDDFHEYEWLRCPMETSHTQEPPDYSPLPAYDELGSAASPKRLEAISSCPSDGIEFSDDEAGYDADYEMSIITTTPTRSPRDAIFQIWHTHPLEDGHFFSDNEDEEAGYDADDEMSMTTTSPTRSPHAAIFQTWHTQPLENADFFHEDEEAGYDADDEMTTPRCPL